ncbi:MAG: hypothetical protein AAFV53_26335 [Myxococcota bacterium]
MLDQLPIAEIRDALLRDGWGAAIIAIGVVTLFTTGEALRRLTGIETEYTRKLSHFGAGALVLAMPWLVDSLWTVTILAGAFFGVLSLGALTGALGSVHDVERRTGGAYYYPLAVLILFWLSSGEPLLFCVPIAVLAIADAGAALVGRRAGRLTFQVLDGKRSWEGSLTFFTLAFVLTGAGVLLLSPIGWPEVLLIALVVAGVTTAAEAISVWGADNLFVPYAGFVVLDRALRLGVDDMGGWLEGMAISTLAVMASSRRAGLTEAGAMSVFVSGTLSWAIGGWAWTLPLVGLYALFLSAIPTDHQGVEEGMQTDLIDIIPITVGAMVVTILYGHFGEDHLFVAYLATISAGGAIAMRQMAQNRDWPQVPLAISGALTPVLPVLLVDPKTPTVSVGVAGLIGLVTYAVLDRTRFVGRRLLACLVAGAIAWAVTL